MLGCLGEAGAWAGGPGGERDLVSHADGRRRSLWVQGSVLPESARVLQGCSSALKWTPGQLPVPCKASCEEGSGHRAGGCPGGERALVPF